MKEQLLKQFMIDLGNIKDTSQHIFSTSYPTADARYWAKSKGTIIIMGDRLFCRTDNEGLTTQLKKQYDDCSAQWFGEVANMKQLERLLQKYNYSISNYAPFFTSSFIEDYDRTDLTIYEADEIQQFKGNSQFKECYMFDENYPDLLGTAIKNGKEIIAMAGMNQTGKYCLELGVQVLPEYRHQGLATKLITAITVEAQQRYPKMVVTYGTQFTHTQSINVAIKSGFNHQWTEIMINSK